MPLSSEPHGKASHFEEFSKSRFQSSSNEKFKRPSENAKIRALRETHFKYLVFEWSRDWVHVRFEGGGV